MVVTDGTNVPTLLNDLLVVDVVKKYLVQDTKLFS